MGLTFMDLEKVRRELKAYIDAAIAMVFGATLVSSTSPLGDTDGAEKVDGARDPDGQKGQRRVVRGQPFGVNGVPPKGLRCYWLRLGSSNVIMIGIAPQQAYGPQNLASGEFANYNAVPGCQQVLDANGNVKVTSGTPSGGAQGDVQVNGGTKKVARVDDTTGNGLLELIGGISTAFGGLKYTAPDGTVTTITATGAQISIAGKITSGANNFKG